MENIFHDKIMNTNNSATLTDEQCRALQLLIKRKHPEIHFSHYRHWMGSGQNLMDLDCLLCGKNLYLNDAFDHAKNHLKENNLLILI